MTDEEKERLRKIKSGLGHLLVKNPHAQEVEMVRDMEWLVFMLERAEVQRRVHAMGVAVKP